MLLDFNLAREPVAADGEAAAPTLGGTLAYMAPEHLEALADGGTTTGSTTGPTSTALGVVLFEALTGSRPFAAPRGRDLGAESLLRLRGRRPPARPPRLRGGPSRGPRRRSRRSSAAAWRPTRDDRYASAADLAADLQAVADDAPARLRPRALAPRAARWLRRNRSRLRDRRSPSLAAVVGLWPSCSGPRPSRSAARTRPAACPRRQALAPIAASTRPPPPSSPRPGPDRGPARPAAPPRRGRTERRQAGRGRPSSPETWPTPSSSGPSRSGSPSSASSATGPRRLAELIEALRAARRPRSRATGPPGPTSGSLDARPAGPARSARSTTCSSSGSSATAMDEPNRPGATRCAVALLRHGPPLHRHRPPGGPSATGGSTRPSWAGARSRTRPPDIRPPACFRWYLLGKLAREPGSGRRLARAGRPAGARQATGTSSPWPSSTPRPAGPTGPCPRATRPSPSGPTPRGPGSTGPGSWRASADGARPSRTSARPSTTCSRPGTRPGSGSIGA